MAYMHKRSALAAWCGEGGTLNILQVFCVFD